ncbi:DUF2334 domain-containing protein [Candidatus Kuenenbacteria bacterium]|nr:DUF2334 domain-containing protein [Candidatus Kuenenbacteria bacterium]
MKQWRIDDIGASTKYYNQWGRQKFSWRGITYFYFPWANYGFLKRVWPFRGWAKYEELTAEEWQKYLEIFYNNQIKPIVAVTATWVDEKSNLIPFPEKFPAEAATLKQAADEGRITVANHGLTHCLVGRHLPHFRYSNRKAHREFWPDLPSELHREHILESQKILEDYFARKIEIFVPSGNVWSIKTYEALKETNIKKVIAARYMLETNKAMEGIEFIQDDNFVRLHDRDLKLHNIKWLTKKISLYEKNNKR